MGLPAKQRTRTSRNDRRSHFALKPALMNDCESCGKKKRPHYACPSCGQYKGKSIVNVAKRLTRRAKRYAKTS